MTDDPAQADIEIVYKRGQFFALGFLAREEMRVYLRDRRLHVQVRKPWKNRHECSAFMIAAAFARLGARDSRVFYVQTGDGPLTRLGYTKLAVRFANCSTPASRDIAAPDFSFVNWVDARVDDFDAEARKIAEAGSATPRHDKVYWAGRLFNEPRRRLVETGRERPDLFEAIDTEQFFDSAEQAYLGRFVPMYEQVRDYRYLIDIEGAGFSGRLKYLLHSGRLLFLQDYVWREWYRGMLEPYVHYVPLAADLSDLVERVEEVRADPRMEARIAANAQAFARQHLTCDAAIGEWARLLTAHKLVRR